MKVFDEKTRNRNRRTLVLLALAFVAPMAVAWMFYLYMSGGGATSLTAHGELYSPARPLHHFELQRAGGGAIDERVFAGIWTLAIIDDPACDSRCAANLEGTEWARLALGEDTPRVQRVWILSRDPGHAEAEALSARHAGLVILHGGPDEARSLIGQFSVPGGTGADRQYVYIVDPLGNLMMRYLPGTDPRSILRDMQRLLKASQVG